MFSSTHLTFEKTKLENWGAPDKDKHVCGFQKKALMVIQNPEIPSSNKALLWLQFRQNEDKSPRIST